VVRAAVYSASSFLYVTTSRADMFQPRASQDISEKKAKDKIESPFTKESLQSRVYTFNEDTNSS